MDVLQSLQNHWNHLSLMMTYSMAMIANLQKQTFVCSQTFQMQLSRTQLDSRVLQQLDFRIPMVQIGLTVQILGSKWRGSRFVSTYRPATNGDNKRSNLPIDFQRNPGDPMLLNSPL